jgi:hypothetical protein
MRLFILIIYSFLHVSNLAFSQQQTDERKKTKEQKEKERYKLHGNSGNIKKVEVEFNSIKKIFELKDPPKYVGEGGSIEIIIRDFNPFLFNLSISERQGIYQNNQTLNDPKTFGAISFSRSTYDIKDLIINIGKVNIPSSTFVNPSVNRIRARIIAIDAETNSKVANLTTQSINLRSAGNTTDSTTASNAIATLKNDLNNLYAEKFAKEAELDIEVKNSNSESDKLLWYSQKIENLLFSFQKVNKISSFYRTLVNTFNVDGLSYDFIFKRKENNLKAYFPEISLVDETNVSVFFNDLLDGMQRDYSNLSRYYNEVVNSITNADNKRSLQQNFQQIENIYSKISFENYAKLIDFIDKIYLSINSDLFTVRYSTKIIDDDADLIFFEISATPVATEQGIPLQPAKMVFSMPIKGGAKIDLSSGLSFNFGLRNRQYRYEKQSNGNYRVTESRNNSLFQPSVVLMAHLYRRNSLESFRIGPSVGIGISDELRYYLGVSFIIGRKQRMNFCLGAVGGTVDYADESVLNKDLTLSDEELAKPIQLQKPSPFRVGGFFAVTFNLTGNNSIFSQKTTGTK